MEGTEIQLKWLKKIKQNLSKHGHHKRLTKTGNGRKKSSGQIWRTVRRKFPVVYKMSLRARVPAKMLVKMRQSANDPKSRGLVRKVIYYDDNGSQRQGYSVILLSNDALTQAGFAKRHGNKDFGRLIKDIRNNDIFTVTMHGDEISGMVVIRPDAKSVKLLHAYGEFDHTKFRWGVFPADLDPISGQLHAKMLSNLISMSELIQLLDKKPPVDLEVKNDEMVVANNKSGQKPKSEAPKDADEVETFSKSSSASEDKNLTASIPTASDSNTSASSSSSSSASNSSSTPYATFVSDDGTSQDDSENNNDQSTSPSASSDSDDLVDQEIQQHTSPSDTEGDDEDQDETDESEDLSNSEPEDSDQQQSDISDFTSNMDDDAKASEENSEFEAAMQEHPVGANRQQRNHEDSQIPTKQSPADFYNQMDDTSNRTFNDNSLGISINYDSDLSAILSTEKPPLFTLKKYKKNNRLGQLINQYKSDCNSELQAYYQEMINSVNEDSISRIGKVVLTLEHRLNVNDSRNPFGLKMSQIGKTYEKQLRYDDENASHAQTTVQNSLSTMRSSYASRIQQRALADFDKQYASYPKQYRAKYEAERHSKTHDTYLREKADLYNRRQHVANMLAYEAWDHILDDARQNVQDMIQKIFAKRRTMQNEVVSLGTHYYEAENESEHDQAAVADNRNDMDRLERKFKREKQQHMKALAHERALNSRQRKRDRHRFNITLANAQKRTDYYRNKYTNVGEQKDKYYRKQYRSKDHELKDARDMIKHKDNQIEEIMKNPQPVNHMWHNPWTYIIMGVTGVAVVTGGLIALHMAVANNSNNSPYLAGLLQKSDNADSVRSSAASSASNTISSVAASASSAVSSENDKSHSTNSANHSDLMTTRPTNGNGYIATSETHNPTNYVEVSRNGKYSTGAAVTGRVNDKDHQLQVVIAKGNEIYLKDNDSGQLYEFNK